MNPNYSSQNNIHLSRDAKDTNRNSNKISYPHNITGFQNPTNHQNTSTLQSSNPLKNPKTFQNPRTLQNSTMFESSTNFRNPSNLRHPASFEITAKCSNDTSFPNAFSGSNPLNKPFTNPYTINRPTVPASLRVNNPELTPSHLLSKHPSASYPDKKVEQSLHGDIAQCGTILQGSVGSQIWADKTLQTFENRSDHSQREHNDDEEEEEEKDLPFLEELGIHPENVWEKTKSVLLFRKIDQSLLQDVDMCGPVFIAACLCCCSLLAGKINFEYIYGLNVTGSIGVFLLLNLMSQKQSISLYSTISVLGYGLFPVVILSCIALFFPLRCLMGAILSILCVVWCTATASRFFETALEMTHQRFLVAYPISLLYGSFVLLTVF
ncbi:protein YIPF7-like [Hylaeus volcanicus]|uniref:protein YIPF7-like n=1 Tax=Hylaeus volcanicus TaxID=313075 RepID=UPI0023B84736|nr:protein YIPF7-like [Hylaeus volcanicus]XP_053993053.1 protein YIPF7-like [Hylaeus volcanicus]